MRPFVRILSAFIAMAAASLTPGIASAAPPAVGPGIYGNFRNYNSQSCLDVRAQDDYNRSGARVQQYHCTGAREQQWAGLFVRTFPVPGSAGWDEYQFKVLRSGMCLQPQPLPMPVGEAPNVIGPFDDGLNLVQEPCNESDELQLWHRVYYQGPHGTSARGWANHRTGKCIDVREASTADGAWIQQYTCNGTDAQVFSTTLDSSRP